MEKVYRFDIEKLDEVIDEVYGTGRYFQYERITGDDFGKVRQAVLETLDNYYLECKQNEIYKNRRRIFSLGCVVGMHENGKLR